MLSLRMAMAIVITGAVATVAGLVGCKDTPTTVVSRRIEDPWAIAQGAGLLPVIVYGRPAFASDEAVAEVVYDAARRPVTWTATPPLVRPGPGDDVARLRLVYVFNGTGGGDACASPLGGEPLPGGEVTLVAGFCDGGQALVRVDGRVGRSEGLDDSRLRRLIGQATRELLAPPPAPRP